SKVYVRGEGQDVRCVRAPFPEARAVFFREKLPRFAPGDSTFVMLRWRDSELLPAFIISSPTRLQEILTRMLGFYPHEMEGESELLATTMPKGDFVFRHGVTAVRLARALEQALQRDVEYPVRLRVDEAEREVIMVGG